MSGNIVEILVENAATFGDRPAIVEGERALGYAELLRDVERAAAYLRERGIGPGSRVLIFVPMSIDLYEILLAVFYLGATAVFVDAWGGKERLRQACRVVSIDAFIGVPKAHLLRLYVPEIRVVPIKLLAGVHRWRPRSPKAIDYERVGPEHPALVTFTTGSTGLPKGANRTHGFLIEQGRAIREHLDPRPDDVDMPALPIFVLSNLAVGSTSVLPDISARDVSSFDPAALLTTMNRRGVTTAIGSPPFFERLARHCIASGGTPESLRRLFVGGSAIFPELAALLVRAFPATSVTVVYGSTEAEPISSVDARRLIEQGGEVMTRGLLAGRPVESLELVILPFDADSTVDPRRVALSAGEPGEICVAGRHVLREYIGGPDVARANRIVTADRVWLRTGDAGYLDAAGDLYLLGRVKQSFIVNGRRIFPLPAEAALRSVEGVAIGAVMRTATGVIGVIELDEQSSRARGDIEHDVMRLGLDIDSVKIVGAIARDPRHRSKIDYEKLRSTIEE